MNKIKELELKKIKITLIRSKIGIKPNHKKILQILGLNKINSSVIKKNNKSTLGLIFRVNHLVHVENID